MLLNSYKNISNSCNKSNLFLKFKNINFKKLHTYSYDKPVTEVMQST